MRQTSYGDISALDFEPVHASGRVFLILYIAVWLAWQHVLLVGWIDGDLLSDWLTYIYINIYIYIYVNKEVNMAEHICFVDLYGFHKDRVRRIHKCALSRTMMRTIHVLRYTTCEILAHAPSG